MKEGRMNKQTAVEWLVSELLDGKTLMPSLIEQAKAMEKEQMEFTAISMIEYALDKIEFKNQLTGKEAFEQYYTQTFVSTND